MGADEALNSGKKKIEWRVFRTSVAHPFNFSALEEVQAHFKYKILNKEMAPDHLLGILAEVEPTVTLGRHLNLEKWGDRTRFANAGVAVHRVDRGGFETYHGPGQWILYLVGRLEAWTGSTRGVRRMVEGLLRVGVDAAAQVGVPLQIEDSARLGLWSKNGKKVGSLGISIGQGVVQHGMAINVFRTQKSFYQISPCGLAAEPGYLAEMRSYSVESQGNNSKEAEQSYFEEVGEALVRAVQKEFRVLDGE